jgi:hypothetical protein
MPVTIQSALDQARPGQTDDLLALIHLGTMLTPLKRIFTGLASSATQNLTEIDATGETTGPSNPNRLAALLISTLRSAAAVYIVTDAGGTASAPGASGPGIALISDDGTTITFPSAVTAFTIEYMPRSYTPMTTTYDAFGGAP